MESDTRMPIVYTWKIKEGLCLWAEPCKSDLECRGKPSPEAEIVKCIIMEYKDYLKLKNTKHRILEKELRENESKNY